LKNASHKAAASSGDGKYALFKPVPGALGQRPWRFKDGERSYKPAGQKALISQGRISQELSRHPAAPGAIVIGRP
jgi:hypothetical protein